MQTIKENPAAALRRDVAPCLGKAMLRWDISGQALLVSDAPRRGKVSLDVCQASWRETDDGLLLIDLPDHAYDELLNATFTQISPLQTEWFPLQSLLASILTRPKGTLPSPPDKPLLRQAMLACARGRQPVLAFADALSLADAAALRTNNTASCRAAAALCAHWLWTAEGVGIPMVTYLSETE